MARFSLRKTGKLNIALLCVPLIYFMRQKWTSQSLSPAHIADKHPKLGDMKVIEEFWVPEKGKMLYAGGPGENGEPVDTKPEETGEKDKAYSLYGFNQYISDKISLARSLPDTRHPA